MSSGCEGTPTQMDFSTIKTPETPVIVTRIHPEPAELAGVLTVT